MQCPRRLGLGEIARAFRGDARLVARADADTRSWSQIQGLQPSFASLPPTCNIHYSFGTAQLPVSDFLAGHYGADLRYLYGDWSWATFGVNTSTIKATLYVQDIANLVHDCIADVRYGRLDFGRRQVSAVGGGVRDETDREYYARMTDDVVALREQFADVETNYTTLLHTYAPLVPDSDINTLKTTLSDTLLHTLDVTANRTTGLGWVIVLMVTDSDSPVAILKFASKAEAAARKSRLQWLEIVRERCGYDTRAGDRRHHSWFGIADPQPGNHRYDRRPHQHRLGPRRERCRAMIIP